MILILTRRYLEREAIVLKVQRVTNIISSMDFHDIYSDMDWWKVIPLKVALTQNARM